MCACATENFCLGLDELVSDLRLVNARIIACLHQGRVTKVEVIQTFAGLLGREGSTSSSMEFAHGHNMESNVYLTDADFSGSALGSAVTLAADFAGTLQRRLDELLRCLNLKFGKVEIVVADGTITWCRFTVPVRIAPVEHRESTELAWFIDCRSGAT